MKYVTQGWVYIYMQHNFEFRDFRDEFGVAFLINTDWHVEANLFTA